MCGSEGQNGLMQGPREDSGFMSGVNPGVRMAERIYNFCKKYHPKTNVMVSGIRKPAGKASCLVCSSWCIPVGDH